MAKRKDSKYLPGKRSDHWIKVKVRRTADCLVIGFTKGKGNREHSFGALQIAEFDGKQLQYRGKVGTGFDDSTMREIAAVLNKIKKTSKPAVVGKLMDEKTSTWLEPKVAVEVSYAQITTDKMFREPVFLRLRPDV